MSAGKLEKKLAQLEKRMREEMHGQVTSLWHRLQAVEEKLRMEHRIPLKVEPPDAARDAIAAGSKLSAVVPVPGAVIEPSSKDEEGVDRRRDPYSRTPDMQPTAINHILEDDDQDEEPIPFAETVWNVVLVLGFSGAGWLDIILTMFLAFLSVLMQVMFMWVLLSSYFLGSDFQLEIPAARAWRASIAHDSKYVDLAGTSLAQRVCNGDGSLIQANEQANLLTDINHFLGLENDDYAADGLQPGTVLSALCILLWCLYLSKEFRAIWISIEASLQIPRARRTVFANGRFTAISYARLVVYLFFRLVRTGGAVCLLYAGQQWLANTKNITELILNSVALGAILEIDEVIFSSMLPKKIQAAIYDLEAIKVRYTRAKSQLEAISVLASVILMVLLPVVVWVLPLTEAMLQVKKAFCEGDQDFVVSYNTDVQMTHGLKLDPFRDSRSAETLSVSELAVLEHAWNWSSTIKMMLFSDSVDSFAWDTGASMAQYVEQLVACIDADQWMTLFGPVFATSNLPRFRSAAASIGRDGATSCAELADKCNDWDSRLVRLVCGQTCQCDQPRAYAWLKVPSKGCAPPCREIAVAKTKDIACRDAPINQDWLSFWDNYPDIMAKHLGIDLTSPQAPRGAEFLPQTAEFMKAVGCVGLISVPVEMLTRNRWCAGIPELLPPLAHICPQSCSCTAPDPPDFCPESCQACGDASNFPASSGITSCEQAAATGICSVPAEATKFCAGTCGICNGTNNGSANCPDSPLPSFFGLGSCADVQANGWCSLLQFHESSVSYICRRACGTCT